MARRIPPYRPPAAPPATMAEGAAFVRDYPALKLEIGLYPAVLFLEGCAMADKPEAPAEPGRSIGPEYRKGGDPGLLIFPENRPRDETGSTPPTPADAQARAIEEARIAREKAGPLGPVAGHGEEEEMERGR